MSFQTVEKWLHDRGESSCSGKIFPPSSDRVKRDPYGHGKAHQSHSLLKSKNFELQPLKSVIGMQLHGHSSLSGSQRGKGKNRLLAES